MYLSGVLGTNSGRRATRNDDCCFDNLRAYSSGWRGMDRHARLSNDRRRTFHDTDSAYALGNIVPQRFPRITKAQETESKIMATQTATFPARAVPASNGLLL